METHSLVIFAFNFSSFVGVNSSLRLNSSTSLSISLNTLLEISAVSKGPFSGGELEGSQVEGLESSSSFFLFRRRLRADVLVGRSPSMKSTSSSNDIRYTEFDVFSYFARFGSKMLSKAVSISFPLSLTMRSPLPSLLSCCY